MKEITLLYRPESRDVDVEMIKEVQNFINKVEEDDGGILTIAGKVENMVMIVGVNRLKEMIRKN